MDPTHWPTDPGDLEKLQLELAGFDPPTSTDVESGSIGGCLVCFGRGGSGPGSAGEKGWAAAWAMKGRHRLASSQVEGESGAPYGPGLLSAREGPLLASAVLALDELPDVLLVNATGLDHPRRAGMAVQLGWATELPTVGVTHRPFVASGERPGPTRGSATPLLIEEEQVGWLVRTREQALPISVSPGWRTDLDTAREVVMASVWVARTPEPIRQARRLARTARSQDAE